MTPAAAFAAVPGLVYVTAATNLDSNVYKAVQVFCPPGTQVIGGSYDLRGAEGAVVLDDFIPSATNLLVGAGEIVGPGEPSDGTTASWQVVATAVCANPVPNYSITERTSNFTRTTAQVVEAPCPPGRSLIGGGASLSNGFGQVSLTGLRMRSASVQAGGDTDVDGYSGQWSVTAYAICGDRLPGWHVAETTSSSTIGRSRVQAAFCSPSERPIGASWNVFEPIQSDRYVARAVISASPDPSVTVSAFAADSGSRSWSLLAGVVCASG